MSQLKDRCYLTYKRFDIYISFGDKENGPKETNHVTG